MSAPEPLRLELERLVRRAQSEQRLPSVTAAVVRAGEPVWETAVGVADVVTGQKATTDTQYRIGSITKTLTAAAVMQLRDAGKLDLDDPLDLHLEGAPHRPTLRALLTHLSGLQRETPGDVWVTLRFLTADELLRDLGSAEQVLTRGARWHYSNLAFALLGQVVERVSGIRYVEVVEQRLLGPLGLTRTSFLPEEPRAEGYLVEPWRDGARREQPVETGSFTPAGQLWSTVGDLCRWAAFLADPDPAVLRPETVAEMRTFQALADHERWTRGWGLGLELRRDGERLLVGHGGAMPGFIAGVYVDPKEQVGAAVLTNSGTAELDALCLALVAKTAEALPAGPEEWRVEEPPPPVIEGALGRWWMEGSELVFCWRKGRLEARFEGAPDWKPPAVFEQEDGDLWRTVSGPEHGEQLRLERDAEGRVEQLFWATYRLTREPTAFGSG